MSNYTNTYSYYSQISTNPHRNMAPKKDQKNINYSQNTYLNEESASSFYPPSQFDRNYFFKGPSNLNENETHSCILASTSFEFDQIIEDNPNNFFELDELSRANSEFIQSSNTINNFNNFSPNSEYFSNDQEFIENKVPEYMEYLDESNQMMIPIAEQFQKEQENSFAYEEDDRKELACYSNEVYSQINHQGSNEIINHFHKDLEFNQQFQSNPQLKSIKRNVSDATIQNQLAKCPQQVNCPQIEIFNDSPTALQSEFNFIDSQKSIFFQNSTNPINPKMRNLDTQKLVNLNGDAMDNINQNMIEASSDNENGFKNDLQSEQICQEFQNMNQSEEVTNGFNYYQYFKTYQETSQQNQNLSLVSNGQQNREQYQSMGTFLPQAYLLQQQSNQESKFIISNMGYSPSEQVYSLDRLKSTPLNKENTLVIQKVNFQLSNFCYQQLKHQEGGQLLLNQSNWK